MNNVQQFLSNAIGEKSVVYLKAKCQMDALPHYVLLYWLTNNVKLNYSGKIPGIDDSILSVSRNVKNKYDGYLKIDDFEFSFEDNSILDMSAVIGICLDFDLSNLMYVDNETSSLINSLILGHQRKFNSNNYSIKFDKSETLNKCEICQNRLFKDNVFVGCLCFGHRRDKNFQ